jgi:glycosyltransferase involved in cell wall biosynthesis
MTVMFSVVIPTIGRSSLNRTLDALCGQSLPRELFELIVVTDGGSLDEGNAQALAAADARLVSMDKRSGPGASRNRGVCAALGEWLVFTEDDVVSNFKWLETAATIIEEHEVDVIVGQTLLPNGKSARRPSGSLPSFIPTNLFVRRRTFDGTAGYCELFFNRRSSVYFREDSDFGFSLVEKGARVLEVDELVVTHPFEHNKFLDPIRWSRRYEMDSILRLRHPFLFRNEVENFQFAGLGIRRPFVQICRIFVLSSLLVAISTLVGNFGLATADLSILGVLGVLGLLIWKKWNFSFRVLPLVPLIPFVLVFALGRGWVRAHQVGVRTSC